MGAERPHDRRRAAEKDEDGADVAAAASGAVGASVEEEDEAGRGPAIPRKNEKPRFSMPLAPPPPPVLLAVLEAALPCELGEVARARWPDDDDGGPTFGVRFMV